MSTRGRTTFQKRQKEIARKEKREMKAERRKQKKLNPGIADNDVFWDATIPGGLEEPEEEPEPENESRTV
jgi:hypothetical protein